MKTALLTLGILMASQSLYAASCETHFKRLEIPNQKIQRVLNCELVSQSSESRNQIYLYHDQLCVTEYSAMDGKTVSSLQFIRNGNNNLSQQIPHKKVSLESDTLKITELEFLTNGGFLPLFFKKNEITITENSSKKPSLTLNFTKGTIAGNYDVEYAGSYTCKKGNSLLDIFN